MSGLAPLGAPPLLGQGAAHLHAASHTTTLASNPFDLLTMSQAPDKVVKPASTTAHSEGHTAPLATSTTVTPRPHISPHHTCAQAAPRTPRSASLSHKLKLKTPVRRPRSSVGRSLPKAGSPFCDTDTRSIRCGPSLRRTPVGSSSRPAIAPRTPTTRRVATTTPKGLPPSHSRWTRIWQAGAPNGADNSVPPIHNNKATAENSNAAPVSVPAAVKEKAVEVIEVDDLESYTDSPPRVPSSTAMKVEVDSGGDDDDAGQLKACGAASAPGPPVSATAKAQALPTAADTRSKKVSAAGPSRAPTIASKRAMRAQSRSLDAPAAAADGPPRFVRPSQRRSRIHSESPPRAAKTPVPDLADHEGSADPEDGPGDLLNDHGGGDDDFGEGDDDFEVISDLPPVSVVPKRPTRPTRAVSSQPQPGEKGTDGQAGRGSRVAPAAPSRTRKVSQRPVAIKACDSDESDGDGGELSVTALRQPDTRLIGNVKKSETWNYCRDRAEADDCDGAEELLERMDDDSLLWGQVQKVGRGRGRSIGLEGGGPCKRCVRDDHECIVELGPADKRQSGIQSSEGYVVVSSCIVCAAEGVTCDIDLVFRSHKRRRVASGAKAKSNSAPRVTRASLARDPVESMQQDVGLEGDAKTTVKASAALMAAHQGMRRFIDAVKMQIAQAQGGELDYGTGLTFDKAEEDWKALGQWLA